MIDGDKETYWIYLFIMNWWSGNSAGHFLVGGFGGQDGEDWKEQSAIIIIMSSSSGCGANCGHTLCKRDV